MKSFSEEDVSAAAMVEPLEQVIDTLKEKLRANHIVRLQQEKCSIEAGFVWSDLLTNLERVEDHCSNIAGCIMNMRLGNLNLHETLRAVKSESGEYTDRLRVFQKKYVL